VPKTGFNPQTVQPLASSYTHAMKTYRGSSGIAPLCQQQMDLRG